MKISKKRKAHESELLGSYLYGVKAGTEENVLFPVDAIKKLIDGELKPLFEIHSFQFPNGDLTSDISNIDLITDEYLEANGEIHTEESMITGKNIESANLSRFGFVITNSVEEPYAIYDTLGSNITDLVFDKVFDESREYYFYVSKNVFTPSTVFFRFVKN